MIDVCLLGTGGMMPLPERRLTSLLLKYNGHSFLVDCGEATQLSIKETGWSFKDIDVLLITHFHADHMAGIPGFLLTMGNCGRTEPLTVIGPKDVEEMVNGLRVISPILPFEIKFIELHKNIESYIFNGIKVNCFKLDHDLDCYGYCFELDRGRKFNPAVAKSLNIPVDYWGKLKTGEITSVEVDEHLISRDMILGPIRSGLKITYCTDTRPVANINKFAENADLFICEGMYGEDDCETKEKARIHKHMLMTEAASIAKSSNASELWLTHFSPKIQSPLYFADKVKSIFANTVISDTKLIKTLNFKEE